MAQYLGSASASHNNQSAGKGRCVHPSQHIPGNKESDSHESESMYQKSGEDSHESLPFRRFHQSGSEDSHEISPSGDTSHEAY